MTITVGYVICVGRGDCLGGPFRGLGSDQILTLDDVAVDLLLLLRPGTRVSVTPMVMRFGGDFIEARWGLVRPIAVMSTNYQATLPMH